MLALLEGKWEKVSLQTNWKLERCTKPKTTDDNPIRSDYSSESPTTGTSGGEESSLQPLHSEQTTERPPQNDLTVKENTRQDYHPTLGTD